MNKSQLLPDCHVQCYFAGPIRSAPARSHEDCRSDFGHLTYHLATALFSTGCWFHQWARLTMDRLVREPTSGVLIPRTSKSKAAPFAICL